MVQKDLELIAEIISAGAPALAPRLIQSLNELVTEYVELKRASVAETEQPEVEKE